MIFQLSTFHRIGCAGVSLLFGVAVFAAEPPSAAVTCQTCHAIEQPFKESALVQAPDAPPLYYAGNKYRREWLSNWLQNPTQIRPAGGFYANHVTTVNGEDILDESSITPHDALSAPDAEAVTDWLMTLAPKQELIDAESDYTPGKVSMRMGAMDFVKFKGCGGCHRDTPEYGGLTGPELYTAWERLQPAYIVSYIRNPNAWDKHSIMPNRALGDTQLHKLADYLHTLAQED